MKSMIIVFVLLLAPLPFALGSVYLIRFKEKKRRLKSPICGAMLRSPGESLIYQIDDATEDLVFYLSFMPVWPLFVYSLHISQSYFGEFSESLFRILSSVLLGAGMIGYCLYNLVKLFNRRTKLRVAYEAERVAGQELNQLLRDGFHVYHDFPAEGFNIDHVIVGRRGVFAVETKGRSKQMTGKGKDDAQVIYNGEELKFPSHTEVKPLAQASDQARWLSKWLSSATGEPVQVAAALTLPGWYVKRVSPNGVPVLNPAEFRNYFWGKKEPVLSDPQIKRIVHQLAQRCRDVQPRSYRFRQKIEQQK